MDDILQALLDNSRFESRVLDPPDGEEFPTVEYRLLRVDIPDGTEDAGDVILTLKTLGPHPNIKTMRASDLWCPIYTWKPSENLDGYFVVTSPVSEAFWKREPEPVH